MVSWMPSKETKGKIPFENIKRITVEPYELSSHIETNTETKKGSNNGKEENKSEVY